MSEHQGRCACGAVDYTVHGALRPVVNCHCDRCRRVTGHFMAATSAARTDTDIADAQGRLTWWTAAPGVQYGFCSVCGSTLFWRVDAHPDHLSIAAGTLDVPTGLTTESAWWVDSASDYHRLDHDLVEYAREPPVDWSQRADQLAASAVAAGRPTAWFEQLYAEGVSGAATLAWDRSAPNPVLVQWAEQRDLEGAGRRAVVVGAGLGADAAYVAQLGYRTTAFDVSPTAVAIASERAPGVEFVTADLLDLPAEWRETFDLVVEIYTVQALPRSWRGRAGAAVADLVAPGGTLVAIQAMLGPDDDPDVGPPWPLTRTEIDALGATGLDVVRIEALPNSGGPTATHWRAELTRR